MWSARLSARALACWAVMAGAAAAQAPAAAKPVMLSRAEAETLSGPALAALLLDGRLDPSRVTRVDILRPRLFRNELTDITLFTRGELAPGGACLSEGHVVEFAPASAPGDVEFQKSGRARNAPVPVSTVRVVPGVLIGGPLGPAVMQTASECSAATIFVAALIDLPAAARVLHALYRAAQRPAGIEIVCTAGNPLPTSDDCAKPAERLLSVAARPIAAIQSTECVAPATGGQCFMISVSPNGQTYWIVTVTERDGRASAVELKGFAGVFH